MLPLSNTQVTASDFVAELAPRRLKPGERVPFNARARRDGHIELGG